MFKQITRVYLWIYITRVTILLAKEYKVVSTLDIWTLENKKLTSHTCLLSYLHTLNAPYNRCTHVREGADKSLARLTSRYCRTELIVLLQRGVFCYRDWKEACQVTRTISTSRCELSSSFFLPPVTQGAKGNSHHSDRNISGTCTIVCHRQKLGGPV